MKTTQEMIAVMKGFLDGKAIQFRCGNHDDWTDLEVGLMVPSWDWKYLDYRIKPEVKESAYRPYENVEEMIEDYKERFNVTNLPKRAMPLIWVKELKSGHYELISGYFGEAVQLNGYDGTMQSLYDYYTYLDGSPCGKLVE